MDDGGRTGEPERIPVLDDVSDVHVRDDRRNLSVLQENQSFLGAGIDAVRGRQQIMDLVGGEPARAGRPFRPGAVGRPLQEAVLGGGEPEGTGIILRDIPDPGIRIPFFDKAVRGGIETARAALGSNPEVPAAVHEQGIGAGIAEPVVRPELPDGSASNVQPEQALRIGADP